MIIKKANIIAFGGIKNKEIVFDNGINIIYGENEKGKSTIQNFIKVWLYGFTGKRTKDIKGNDRLRFTPISGEKMSGELLIKHEDREYIIKRSFGSTKKEDISEVLDAQTGEAVDYINKEEPGKYFLGVNSATFIRTLFIGQLGVLVNKDKEEDLMERGANLLATGDEMVSMHKSITKLENLKKQLTTPRKNGSLDNLKEKLSALREESFIAYKLSEENIENEKSLISLGEKKEFLKQELKNLDIYKKYLKRSKLQKEYDEITQYLKRREELKKEKSFIEDSIGDKDGVIDINLINDLKEENSLYLTLVDMKVEAEKKLVEMEDIYASKTEEYKDLLFVEEFDDGLKEHIFKQKSEIATLRDKIFRGKQINEEIKKSDELIEEKKLALGDGYKFIEIRDEVKALLANYEEKLKELKSILDLGEDVEGQKKKRKALENKLKNIKVMAGAIALVSVIAILFLGKIGGVISIPLLLGCAFLVNLIIKGEVELKSYKNQNEKIDILSKEIDNIEEKLFSFKNIVKANDYQEFMLKLKKFDDFIDFIRREEIKIEEKELQLNTIDLKATMEAFKNIQNELQEILEKSNSKDIDEVIYKINKYEELSRGNLSYKIEKKKEEESLQKLNNELKIREDRIRDKVVILGIDRNIEMMSLEEKLLQIKDKISKREDLKNTLLSIEETYNALVKDKDIENIESEIKEFINEEINYSYKTEDEIDNQVKINSNELLEVEKELKDVENSIKTRYIGKRTVVEVEEDISRVLEEVSSLEVKLKAVELAIEKLKESFAEIRGSFSPILNSRVLENFRRFTNDKYKEVLVSESYEIRVRDDFNSFKGELLSNGANDQLYLSLRLAFINMIFNEKDVPVILDDAFVQYDDKRVENVVTVLEEMNYNQLIIFTCQNREREILLEKNIEFNNISL